MKKQTEGRYTEWIEKHLTVGSVNGSEYKCLCVFHDDTNPSMQINCDTGLVHCFSCGSGGSIVKVAEALGINDFKRAEPDIADIRRKLRCTFYVWADAVVCI